MNKADLRKYIKVIRRTLDLDILSNQIVENIRKLNEYKYSQNVMLFYPLKGEINLLKLLDDTNKNFFLPKVHGEKLMVCPYKKGDRLKESIFKTLEPVTLPVDKRDLDLIIVPALCVDKNNYRLGYGKGFYDRFLHNNKTTKITPIPECLILDLIPHDDFDEKIDLIVTENC